MSMGYGGFFVLEEETETSLIYNYGAYNLNIPEGRNSNWERDGKIIIDKEALEASTREVLEWLKSPECDAPDKDDTKRYDSHVDLNAMLEAEEMVIETSKYDEYNPYSHTYNLSVLLNNLFLEHQRTGVYPKRFDYHC